MGYNPNQPRHPAGSAQGGEWAPAHGGGGAAADDGAKAAYAKNPARDLTPAPTAAEMNKLHQQALALDPSMGKSFDEALSGYKVATHGKNPMAGRDDAQARRTWLAGAAEEERRVEGMSPRRYRMHLEKKIARLGRGSNLAEAKRILEKLQAWASLKEATPRRVRKLSGRY